MFASRWLQLEIICPTTLAETLGALMIEGGSLGVQERDLDDAHPQTAQPGALLIAFFDADFPREQQRDIESMLSNFGDEVSILHWSEHRDDGWSTRWKSFFHPLPIGEQIVICPTWEEFTPTPTQKVIHIDPGMAFGTGHHATTRSCILLLEEYLTPGIDVLDVGCGSGILSFAAHKLGAQHTYGVDIDPDAIMVANENAELNKCMDVCTFSVTPIEEIETAYPFVVANIQAHILNPMVQDIRRVVQPEGLLLLSGILGDQAQRVRAVYENAGFGFIKRHDDGEWTSIVLRG